MSKQKATVVKSGGKAPTKPNNGNVMPKIYKKGSKKTK